LANEIMMTLGEFRFGLSTATYQEFKRVTAYRWASQDVFNHTPSMQFLGPGADEITLTGVIYTHFKGGLTQLDNMRSEAAKGEALLLTDGLGEIHGDWVIKRIAETQSKFIAKGAPRKQSFTMALSFYGE
jgi:phage protein U